MLNFRSIRKKLFLNVDWKNKRFEEFPEVNRNFVEKDISRRSGSSSNDLRAMILRSRLIFYSFFASASQVLRLGIWLHETGWTIISRKVFDRCSGGLKDFIMIKRFWLACSFFFCVCFYIAMKNYSKILASLLRYFFQSPLMYFLSRLKEYINDILIKKQAFFCVII